MSALYIHIPYCKQACHYCDFHFSTNTQTADSLIEALIAEAKIQAHFLPDNQIHTLYFGGGTPSMLSEKQFIRLLNGISEVFDFSHLSEFTLEANPDDIDVTKLEVLNKIGVNRLSVGIQSLNEDVLGSMNRAHTSVQAIEALKLIKEAGFTNYSLDLMFGFPSDNHRILEKDLEVFLSWRPPHISAYALTIEPRTALGKWTNSGKFNPATDSFIAEQFELVYQALESAGYLAYEVSNFAFPGFESKHNSHYWKQLPYLGLGPSAHSFSGTQRFWNLSNNAKYIRTVQSGSLPQESEVITPTQWANEVLLTGLRTSLGADVSAIESKVAATEFEDFLKKSERLVEQGFLLKMDNRLSFSLKGRLVGDHLTSQLFFDEPA